MLQLRYETTREWVDVVEADLVRFLQDHAANEHRVSRAALTLAVQYPERTELVDAMVEVSLEELTHFKQVYELLNDGGLIHGVFLRGLRRKPGQDRVPRQEDARFEGLKLESVRLLPNRCNSSVCAVCAEMRVAIAQPLPHLRLPRRHRWDDTADP